MKTFMILNGYKLSITEQRSIGYAREFAHQNSDLTKCIIVKEIKDVSTRAIDILTKLSLNHSTNEAVNNLHKQLTDKCDREGKATVSIEYLPMQNHNELLGLLEECNNYVIDTYNSKRITIKSNQLSK